MKELILMISYWIHLVATVIWIGGIAFTLFITIPSSKQVLGADAGKLMGEIAKRFTRIVNYCIVFMIITGIVLTILHKEFAGFGILKNDWTIVLLLKHILVFGMIIIHFYRGLVLTPKIKRTISDTDKANLQKLSINLVKVNFVLGLMVLLRRGIMYVLSG